MKSLKRWTPRPLSDSNRVMSVSCATVPSKQQDRCPTGRYKNIYQFPRAEVKTIQRLFICRVLWAQRQCSARCSVTHTEAPGAGAGRGPGRGRWQTVPSLTRLTLSWVWLWSRVGHVLTLSQPLGYSYKVEITHRELIRIQCGEDSNEELNFKMLLIQKLVNSN